MKKLFLAMSVIFGLGLATAQQTAPAKTNPTTKTAKPAKVKKEISAEKTKTATADKKSKATH
ncbi:hypothetical protein ODZ84_15570 [Chryseobacterium fluminis]|uniref:hypothetical protein n=1 Tax=Chryseobacterium fluminis TaxID=2983606 RepID=UPI002250684A|nr:hypothetical protein [Chryseobacterium sp. MMS21-Ot14]UZT96634.1 hypothetical protein ODZ84_15570 [Chryseobacterium sp. MMS21-Ot14]